VEMGVGIVRTLAGIKVKVKIEVKVFHVDLGSAFIFTDWVLSF